MLPTYISKDICCPITDKDFEYLLQNKQDITIWHKLILGHVRLIISVVLKKYKPRDVDTEDLISVGIVAIMELLKNFDLNNDVNQLKQTLVKTIYRALSRYWLSQNLICVPPQIMTNIRKLKELENYTKDELSIEELSRLLFKSHQEIIELLSHKQKLNIERCTISKLDTYINNYYALPINNKNICLADIEQILRYIKISDTTKEIFTKKYGLLNNKTHSFKQLSKQYQISISAVEYQIAIVVKKIHNYVNNIKEYNICKICKKEFIPNIKHPNQIYCSVKCKDKNHHHNKIKQQKLCSYCSKPFTPKRKNMLYCQDQCTKKARNLKRSLNV